MRPVLITFVIPMAGCASSRIAQLQTRTSQLETRIHELERRVAAVRWAQISNPTSGCTQVADASVPIDTAFPFTIQVDIGRTDLHNGDAIAIEEVRGTSPTLTVGGMYAVRGTYALASAPAAELGLHATATQPGEGCTHGNGHDSQEITRGTGRFELAIRLAYEGHPHVSFYVERRGSGGVYFGTGTWLLR